MRVGCFSYPGYPLRKIQRHRYLAVIEGLIYNFSDTRVERALDEICSGLDSPGGRVDESIARFLRDSDGDYLILLRAEQSRRGAVFGDRYARLPVFYGFSGESFLLSRELKPLLRALPSISFDRQGLAEFLSWQHCFGSRTLFNETKQLRPAEIVRFGGESQRARIIRIDELTPEFQISGSAPNNRAAIENLAEIFVAAVEARARAVTENNLKLTCDLSGGYDTRAVFGALCGSGASFRACTDTLVTGDESETATGLASLFERDVTRFHAVHRVSELTTLQDAVSETNCSVNAWTAASSLSDDNTRAGHFTEPSANFMGFGGEWLRKPLVWDTRFKTVSEALRGDAYTSFLPLSQSCSLLGLSRSEFMAALESRFPAHSLSGEAGARSIFFEYFSKVVNSGEEITRRFFWTLSPFWANVFFTYNLQSVPTRWTGYRFFANFLSALDPRLLRAPIHGSAVNLSSELSLRARDWRAALRRRARK
ncbi:MAG: hypothetical protein ACE5GA_11280, partial [Candidatus Zixiibacteriota bacterium]